MAKIFKSEKNFLNTADKITKAMIRRRGLAQSAICNICDIKSKMRVVK